MANILVIDDDLNGADALSLILQAEGHAVRVGYNGEEGLELLNEQRLPDLVLVDVEMPLLTGPGMSYQMIARDCGRELVPIAFLSGVPNLEDVAAHAGTPYFLSKPYRYEDVLVLVDRMLAERLAPQPTYAIR
jgi:CheY-like chemotaxis protein